MSIIQTIVTSLFHGHSVKTDPMPDFNLERYLGGMARNRAPGKLV